MIGTLTVDVIEGDDLHSKELARPDPFVIIYVESQNQRTQFIKNNHKPKWNETFSFYVTQTNAELKCTVYDWEKSGNHRVIGQIAIPFTAFKNKEKIDNWFDLQPSPGGKEKVKGSIHISYLFDIENAVKEEIKALDDDLKQSIQGIKERAMILEEKYSKEIPFLRTQLDIERKNLASTNNLLAKTISEKQKLDEEILFFKDTRTALEQEKEKLLKEKRVYKGEELPETIKELQDLEKELRTVLVKIENKKDKVLTEHKMCVMCGDRERSIVLVPCGHICVCEPCGHKSKDCSICKTAIHQKIKIAA